MTRRLLIVIVSLIGVCHASPRSPGQPKDDPPLKATGKGKTRVLPDLGEDPLARVAKVFAEGSKGVGATPEQIKRDVATLDAEFSAKGSLYEKALKRKLLSDKPTKREVEYLKAVMWWEYRTGPKRVPFDKEITAEAGGSLLGEMVLVYFDSTPEGADVFVAGSRLGKTSAKPPRPSTYLKTTEKYEIRLAKTGFQTHLKADYTPPNDGETYSADLKP
jgi:hypothetical protein